MWRRAHRLVRFTTHPVALAAAGAAAGLVAHQQLSLAEGKDAEMQSESPPWQQADATRLPTFSSAEVARHTSVEHGVWVTFDGAVYDITHFVQDHPGGVEKIMTAAGGPVEPFWALYRQHLTSAGAHPVPKPHICEVLGPLQVGWLDPSDVAKAPARAEDDPYREEPVRHAALTMVSEVPCSAETPPQLMVDSWITYSDFIFCA